MKDIISRREQEVLELISLGYIDKEIASILYLSLNTVKTHRKSVIEKLACRNAPASVRKAFELQILPLAI